MLENRLKQEKDFRRKLRLHMLHLLKRKNSQTGLEVSETLVVHRNTIGIWLSRTKNSARFQTLGEILKMLFV